MCYLFDIVERSRGMAQRRTLYYKGYTGIVAGCLIFDVLCWNIVKWCILKPIWFAFRSIITLFRCIGKQL